MADLRLVGVHDDGKHLLLSGTGGEIFLLPIDEALRMATTRAPRKAPSGNAGPAKMSPREIQAQIRAGATAADVAEHSGMSLEQVRRYEGPVLAEREHVARLARKVEVSGPAAGNDSYRSAFGDNPATLDEMVMHRVSAFGIDPRTVRWDAWRVRDGAWTVTADFEPGSEWAAASIGEPAPARWTFHPGRKSLNNANRWAQQLSEMEPLDGPVPERRLSAVADRPFDFETDAPDDGTADTLTAAGPGGAEGQDTGSEDDAGSGLLDMLRSRRGQRLGLDEDGDDELAAMLGTHVPAAHPRDGHEDQAATAPAADGADTPDTMDNPADVEAPAAGAGTDTEAPDLDNTGLAGAGSDGGQAGDGHPAGGHGKKRLRAIPFLSLAPRLHGDEDHHHAVGVGEVSTDTREITLSGAPSLRRSAADNAIDTGSGQDGAAQAAPAPESARQPADAEDGPSDSEVAARLERKAAGKPKRSSVPSWDEIVFGTKGD
ncbi:septation protein SepH [Arthrobacter sp. SDTb3-6]|uniref:septation protein SepH n=1 Tax=Arthrobacter sp. SDTb3-6 TaxID=2713571 RepID=UPI00159DE3CD|nr:septation protein SepH [Arthrobacter sp. SDTb3-6]NVM97882.1 DUF3071 domain-containing protein [Arthrobacter sp. SDTb3-6]